MLEKMLKYLVAGTAGLALGCSPVDSERLGCISDDDCKGDRECVQGECVTSALDAYVGVEEVASCSLDKYVCIDEKTVGALDTCGLTSLYSKCLDSEICSSGECVDKPCEEFTGDSFYEGFDGPLDPCKWEYSEGNKGEIIDGYWVSGEGQGIIKAKYDPGCEDFTLSMRGRITVKDSEHQSLGFVYNGIGLGMEYNNEIDKSSITMQCPVGSNKTDGLDFFNFHEFRVESKGNLVEAFVDNQNVEDIIVGGYFKSPWTTIGDFYPPWVCSDSTDAAVGLVIQNAAVDYVELKCD